MGKKGSKQGTSSRNDQEGVKQPTGLWRPRTNRKGGKVSTVKPHFRLKDHTGKTDSRSRQRNQF